MRRVSHILQTALFSFENLIFEFEHSILILPLQYWSQVGRAASPFVSIAVIKRLKILTNEWTLSVVECSYLH